MIFLLSHLFPIPFLSFFLLFSFPFLSSLYPLPSLIFSFLFFSPFLPSLPFPSPILDSSLPLHLSFTTPSSFSPHFFILLSFISLSSPSFPLLLLFPSFFPPLFRTPFFLIISQCFLPPFRVSSSSLPLPFPSSISLSFFFWFP